MLKRLFGTPPDAQIQIVPADEVKRWAEAGELVLIDVREPNEHAAQSIPGALNLPLSSFDPAQLPPVPEGKKLVFHCQSGMRCGAAAEQARLLGYRGKIHRLKGGIFGWQAAGGSFVPGR